MTSYENDSGENSILIVAPQPAADLLLEQCVRHGWSGSASGSFSEAVAALQLRAPAIVFTQDALPDGTWREVFQSSAAIRPGAMRVVCSDRCTLPLWMDVLAQGGHELLPEPCPDELLERVLNRCGQRKCDTCDSV